MTRKASAPPRLESEAGESSKPPSGWVLYDGDCGFCTTWARRFEKTLRRRGFDLEHLQTPWVRKRLGLPEDELLEEMKILSPADQVIGGADGVLYLARRIWWAWPLLPLGWLPGGRSLLRAGYRLIARNRHCLGGECKVETEKGSRANRFLAK